MLEKIFEIIECNQWAGTVGDIIDVPVVNCNSVKVLLQRRKK